MNQFYESMHEVLAGPKYDILTGRSVDYQQLIMEAIGRTILGLLEQVRFNVPDPTSYNVRALAYIFVIVSGLLLLAAAMAITYIILKRRKGRTKQNAAVATIFDDIASRRFTLPELLSQVRLHAENNQLREAVRCYYIAVLISLDENRTIIVDKSKTNEQLTREIALAAPSLFEPFVSVVDVFQQSWFGFKMVDADAYERFEGECIRCMEGRNL